MTRRVTVVPGTVRLRRWVWLVGLIALLLAACEAAPAGTPAPTSTPTPPPWRPPVAPVALDNVTHIGLLGIDRQPRGTTFRMDFSADGAWMLGVSGDGAVRLWDLALGEPVWARENEAASAAYFAAGDSQFVLVGISNRQVDIFAAADQSLVRSFSGYTAQIGPSALAAEDNRLVLGAEDGKVIVWDLIHDEIVYALEAASMPVQGLALSPDGRILAAISPERAVRLFDMTTGETQAILADFDQPVRVLAFSPDGMQVAIGFEHQVRVWAAADGAPLLTLNTAERAADRQLVFTPDGYLLGGGVGSDTVSMWDLASGELYAGLPGHEQAFSSMALSPNGDLLVTVAQPGSAYLWNMSDPNQRVELATPDQQVSLAGWSKDGRVLVLAVADGALVFWGIPGEPVVTPTPGV